MQNKILRKGLVVGIIILFVSVSVLSSVSSKNISILKDRTVENTDKVISLDEQIDGKLVDNVILQWLGTITFSDIFLAFLGLPVYFTRLHIRNNNDIGVGCEAYITFSTGAGTVLIEDFYNPPYKTNPHSTDTLLIYTLHELKYYNYLWGHFDITIDYHVLEDGSSITKVFHGFLFKYGSFIYDKNGEIIR